MTITANDLPRIVADHVRWLAGEPDGRRADLRRADLRGADLRRADLRGAVLRGADLRGADLRGADLLPDFQIPQEGTLTAWKAVRGGIAKIEVPADARRTACLVNRKCRAEFVRVIEIVVGGEAAESAPGLHDASIIYRVGEITRPDSYDANPAVDCTHGIHFFLTKEEAMRW